MPSADREHRIAPPAGSSFARKSRPSGARVQPGAQAALPSSSPVSLLIKRVEEFESSRQIGHNALVGNVDDLKTTQERRRV